MGSHLAGKSSNKPDVVAIKIQQSTDEKAKTSRLGKAWAWLPQDAGKLPFRELLDSPTNSITLSQEKIDQGPVSKTCRFECGV